MNEQATACDCVHLTKLPARPVLTAEQENIVKDLARVKYSLCDDCGAVFLVLGNLHFEL